MLQSYLAGDTIPLPDSVLLGFLPKRISGYSATHDKGSTFQTSRRKFSYAERVFQGKERLTITINDYAADTMAIVRYWEKYEYLTSNAQSNTYFEEGPMIFGWQEIDSIRHKANLYASIQQRFWVEISFIGIQEDESYPYYMNKSIDLLQDLSKKGMLGN